MPVIRSGHAYPVGSHRLRMPGKRDSLVRPRAAGVDEDRDAAVYRLDGQLGDGATLLAVECDALPNMHGVGKGVRAMANQEVRQLLKSFGVHSIVGRKGRG